MKRYNHLDYDQLETFLKESETRRCLIASETVFGMDGDRADISILSELAQKYNALLYLDEAHATGLYGPQGYGMTEGAALDPERTIVMGTFSKALGSSGAYIATNRLLIDFLIQRCRSFIYSTSLSPFVSAQRKKLGTLFQHWKTRGTAFSLRAVPCGTDCV